MSDTVRALVKCQFTFSMTFAHNPHMSTTLSTHEDKGEPRINRYTEKNLRSEGGEGVKFNCNRFAPLIGGIAILPVASCHRNHDTF